MSNFGNDTVTMFGLEGTQLGTFPVGRGPRDFVFDGEAIWVASVIDETITKLAPDGTILGTYPVSDPTRISFDGKAIWVTNVKDDSVTRMALDGTQIGTFPVGVFPSGVGFDGQSLWVASLIDDTISKLSVDGVALGTFSVGSRPGAVTFDGGAMWVGSGDDDTITKLGLDGTVLGTFAVGGRPGALAFDGRAIWAAAGCTVTKLALDGSILGTYNADATDIEFDGQAMWVLEARKGAVTRIPLGVRPASGPVTYTIDSWVLEDGKYELRVSDTEAQFCYAPGARPTSTDLGGIVMQFNVGDTLKISTMRISGSRGTVPNAFRIPALDIEYLFDVGGDALSDIEITWAKVGTFQIVGPQGSDNGTATVIGN